MVSELTIGIVKIGDVEKLAVIKVFDRDGNPMAITDQMQRTTAVYQRYVQQMIDKHDYYNFDTYGNIQTITDVGIGYQDGIPEEGKHVAAQTQELWNAFIYALFNPQLMETGTRVEVETLDLTPIKSLAKEARIRLYTSLYGKLSRGEAVDDELEKLALRAFNADMHPASDQDRLEKLAYYILRLQHRG